MTNNQQRTPKTPTHSLFNDTAKSVGSDYERYSHLLNETGFEEEEKQEILQALWNIITEFVQMGFGVHPIQKARSEDQKDRGQVELSPAVLAASMVHSTETIGGPRCKA